jgi:hypothetical protein
MWIHMPKHESKASSFLAINSSKSESKDHKIHVRAFDAVKAQCVEPFFKGESVGFALAGDPK